MSKKSWPKYSKTWVWEAAKCHGENGDLGLRKMGGSVIRVNSLVLLGLSMAPKQMGIILFLPIMRSLRWSPKMKFMKVFTDFHAWCRQKRFYVSHKVKYKGSTFLSALNLNPTSNALALIIKLVLQSLCLSPNADKPNMQLSPQGWTRYLLNHLFQYLVNRRS